MSNQAPDFSVQIINNESKSKDKTDEIKNDGQPKPRPEPIDSKNAESDEAKLLGEKRSRSVAELTEISADIELLFKARDTMKRAKKEYDEARKTIQDLFEPIKKAFDMPEHIGSKPSSPKE